MSLAIWLNGPVTQTTESWEKAAAVRVGRDGPGGRSLQSWREGGCGWVQRMEEVTPAEGERQGVLLGPGCHGNHAPGLGVGADGLLLSAGVFAPQ